MAQQHQPFWDEAFVPPLAAAEIPPYVRFVRFAARVALGCGVGALSTGLGMALFLFLAAAPTPADSQMDAAVFFGGMLAAGIEYLLIPSALIASVFVLVETRRRAVVEAIPPLAEQAVRHVKRSRRLALGGLGLALVLPALLALAIGWSFVGPLVEQQVWRADFSARHVVLDRAVAYVNADLARESITVVSIALPAAVQNASSSRTCRIYVAGDGAKSYFFASSLRWDDQPLYGYAYNPGPDDSYTDDALHRVFRLAPHWWVAIDRDAESEQQATD